ncbi:PREDICTED: probable disease resistance RPP8-like protein 4 [Nelumbo nucifera]|uniref:Probable disease resistance RPP8-like protein 4 n=1 Tax=Nelumbo nucifera TaxID=4432 RepID=A0A1U7YX03_NELNU|nr:PREDICTED: probable disease resistance RPP8-like protein 4 [Nelumbo nucifera]XP_010245032.1 PREDICTED: probable disease resistance RPP8-like protein 4 [Nelumbo nucifera]
MADIAVREAIRKFTNILGDLSLEEGIRFYRLDEQIEWIRKELDETKSFLIDADAKQEGDERVKNWVRDVRDFAYDTEDIIGTYFLKRISWWRRKKRLFGFLGRFACICCDSAATHEFVMQIEGLKRRSEDIKRSRDTYGIECNVTEAAAGEVAVSFQQRREYFSKYIEPDIVGFVEDIKVLKERLLDERIKYCVIPIVGMGGLGKTTLAKKVYNDVKPYFHCHAWVYISGKPRLPSYILEEIAKKIGLKKEEWEENVEKNLLSFLKERSYIIVLDDLWAIEVWEFLKEFFPDTMNGSRIIVTTRNHDVAKHVAQGSSPHELGFLSYNESWQLFSKKVFPDDGIGRFPPELEPLGRQILKRCGQLPLAIVVMGGLLSLKDKAEHVWLRVLQCMEGEANGECQMTLYLSYIDLPYYLKPCFLYFGLLPEDLEIPVSRLINLWMAEGFIQYQGQLRLEDVARGYLDELIYRNLIQVAKRSFGGRVKACTIHDVLHEFCISKAKEDDFFGIYRNLDSDANAKMRRLAIYCSVCSYISLNHYTSKLRALLCFQKDWESLEKDQRSKKELEKLEIEHLRFIYTGFTLLRVLNLEGVQFEDLPDEFGILIHLKYLGLRDTKFKSLPSTISNLKNLETLDIQSTNYYSVPSVIWLMTQLRHIILDFYAELRNPFIFGYRMDRHRAVDKVSLPNLQTLWMIQGSSLEPSCLCEMTSLRELKIHGQIMLHSKVLSTPKAISDQLENLQLEGRTQFPFPDVPVIPALMLSHYGNLRQLVLQGKLEKLPNHDEFPPNLTKLSLQSTNLLEDPMATLSRLLNLRNLVLGYWSYLGNKLVCSEGGFPKLEVFKLIYLDQLKEWRVDGGAFPQLRALKIKNCEQLDMLPDGLRSITTLTQLELNMPERFYSRFQRNGEDWDKIQHVHSIITWQYGKAKQI